MHKTALEMTPEELSQYDPTKNLGKFKDIPRWEKAWEVAHQIAKLLREKFGATRIVVFGSMVDQEWFTHWSDIDLAVWGIPPEIFIKAMVAVDYVDPSFEVDLVDPERCRPSFQKMIEKKGIEI